MTRKSMLLLACAILCTTMLISGCDCKRVEVVEERMVAVPEESYDIEYYTITEPYFVEEPKKIPRVVEKMQEVELDACGDILVISNPSDERLTIVLKRNEEGYFLFSGLERMQANALKSPSYELPVYYTDRQTPLLDISSRITLKPYESVEMQYRGLLNPYSISCYDQDGNLCRTYAACDKSLGNNIFDLEKIKRDDIELINPTITRVTEYDEQMETVKRYRKVVKNRTVIKIVNTYELKNVTVKRWSCG